MKNIVNHLGTRVQLVFPDSRVSCLGARVLCGKQKGADVGRMEGGRAPLSKTIWPYLI